MPVPKQVQKQIALKVNRTFLKQLYRLPFGSSKVDRAKALNKGNLKQRMLLIHILHQIMKGEIPLRKEDSSVINQSGKLEYLKQHFQDKEDVQHLLAMNDAEQKKVLAGVNNYHVLLHKLFNL